MFVLKDAMRLTLSLDGMRLTLITLILKAGIKLKFTLKDGMRLTLALKGGLRLTLALRMVWDYR